MSDTFECIKDETLRKKFVDYMENALKVCNYYSKYVPISDYKEDIFDVIDSICLHEASYCIKCDGKLCRYCDHYCANCDKVLYDCCEPCCLDYSLCTHDNKFTLDEILELINSVPFLRNIDTCEIEDMKKCGENETYSSFKSSKYESNPDESNNETIDSEDDESDDPNKPFTFKVTMNGKEIPCSILDEPPSSATMPVYVNKIDGFIDIRDLFKNQYVTFSLPNLS